MKSISLKYSN